MQIDEQQYIEENEPINLLYLMDEAVLKNLLNGYCFAISAGLSVIFKKVSGEPSIETLDRIDALEEKAKEVFYPLCEYFRTECGCDQVCQKFDKAITLQYYKKERNGPKLYRCPLQLWDMTYPLSVGSNIVGVLFAGQVVVKDKEVNWRKSLKKIENQIEWGNFAGVGNQVEDVCGAIKKMNLGIEQETEAERKVRAESKEGRKNVSVEILLKRYEEFLGFGQMMETLLGQLYELIHLPPERSQFARVLKGLHDINAKILTEPKRMQTLEHIAESAKNVFGADSCSIWEYDINTGSFRDKPSTGLDTKSPRSDGIGAEVIERGVHIIEDNAERLHDEARKAGIVCSGGFPLQLKAINPVGVMYLHFRKHPHFTERDLEMVDLFSYNAGLAVRLAEFREESDSRIEDLQALRDANVSVSEARNLREALQQVVRSAIEVMPADAAILYPYDEQTKKFKKELVVAEGEIDMKKFKFENPRPKGLTHTIMKRTEPLWERDIDNVSKERIKLIDKIRNHVLHPNNLKSLIGIALKSGEDQLGVLYVFFKNAHNPNGEELIALSIFADLAATRIQLAKLSEAQQRAEEADEIALRNLLTAQFAHRLANVAGTIPLVVQDIEGRLRLAGVSEDQIWARFSDLKEDINRLLEMADYSRLRDIGRPVRVDLKTVAQESIKSASLKVINTSVNVSTDIPDDLAAVRAVKALLVDILINLLQNAAQANAKHIEIRAIDREEMVDIIVADDGKGIPEGDVDKVFMPFFSKKGKKSKGKAHGRGLWVARHQIRQMGGRITARNISGSGACFTISLKKFDD